MCFVCLFRELECSFDLFMTNFPRTTSFKSAVKTAQLLSVYLQIKTALTLLHHILLSNKFLGKSRASEPQPTDNSFRRFFNPNRKKNSEHALILMCFWREEQKHIVKNPTSQQQTSYSDQFFPRFAFSITV
jgi:hypothetical protein